MTEKIIEEMPIETLKEELNSFLKPIYDGFNIGLISDAGCPGVADPGSDIIKIAHELNIKVVPLVGPSSILLAIMSSGLNGQNFAFNGYLPIDKSDRKKIESCPLVIPKKSITNFY